MIAWAKTQSWYVEPFVLAGHSLGAICSALYAAKYSGKVKALAPISTVVSGRLSTTVGMNAQILEEWRRTGWRVSESTTTPGHIKRLKWSHMEDRLRYDLLPDAKKLMMPVLMIVGSKDEGTPSKHQKILFDALPGRKELHIIAGAPHTFQDQKHLTEIKEIFSKWIATL